jgi:hypothetical protein
MREDVLLVASESLPCKNKTCVTCPGRILWTPRELRVCVCECHDGGEAHPMVRRVMSELGKIGGRRGGAARAAALSPQERHDIAVRAARARWDRPRVGA